MRLLTFIAIALFATASQAAFLLNDKNDLELPISSNVRYQEVTARAYSFTTTVDNQEVQIAAAIPFTINQAAGTYPAVGAWRLYIDGDGYLSIPINDNFGKPVTAKMWNGDILINEGRWCYDNKIADGGLMASIKYVVPTAGTHVIRLQYVGSQLSTVGTLRSRARLQVW